MPRVGWGPLAVATAALLGAGIGRSVAGEPDAPAVAAASPASVTERAEALVARLRQGLPGTRDDVTRELLELASH